MKLGILIHPDELSESWVRRICGSELSLFGLHPVGGNDAPASMDELIRDRERLEPYLEEIRRSGIGIEHEMHALRWFVPAELSDGHPDWFRMNGDGLRTTDHNICATNGEALAYVEKRAEEAARLLPSSTHRYHFWIDDVDSAKCHCEKCAAFTASDQALLIYNAIARGVRRADPSGRQCYLAYHGTLEAPVHVMPEENIFLEYAPMDRDFTRPIGDAGCEKNVRQTEVLDALFELFGYEDATVCEYWLDNSMYSGWKKPPKKFTWDESIFRADAEYYASRGFGTATTFACYLGDEYREACGEEADIDGYLHKISP